MLIGRCCYFIFASVNLLLISYNYLLIFKINLVNYFHDFLVPY
jgi:hypothetical protein